MKEDIQHLNDPTVLKSWFMYDWANSVYSLTITSATFPVYYNAVTSNVETNNQVSFFGMLIDNNVLYSYALSISFLIVSLILPLLSGLADFSQSKKFFMKIFVYTGALACMGLYFFDGANIEYGIICCVLASIGYSGSLVFYDAFLPEIATEDRFDVLSAKGYSYGYIGSVLLLMLNLFAIIKYDWFGFENESMPTKLGFLVTGLWWLGFSLIPFKFLPKDKGFKVAYKKIPKKERLGLFIMGYKEVRDVYCQILKLKNLKRFLWAFLFYNMGVQTIMYLAALFGSDELKLESTQLITTVLLLNIVAILGASLFAKLSKKIGNIKTLLSIIMVWIGVTLYAYFIYTPMQFYVAAFFIGMVMGGIQALSRATYSKLLPEGTKDTASFLMFFDITFNISIVAGTFVYGLINDITGSMRNSVFILCCFFVIGAFLLKRVKMDKHSVDLTPIK